MTYVALMIHLATGGVVTIEFADQRQCAAMLSIIGGPNVASAECVEILRIYGVAP